MNNNYPLILSLTDRLNELNEKINGLLAGKTDNVVVGTIIMGAILVVTFWAINELNKK